MQIKSLLNKIIKVPRPIKPVKVCNEYIIQFRFWSKSINFVADCSTDLPTAVLCFNRLKNLNTEPIEVWYKKVSDHNYQETCMENMINLYESIKEELE